MGFANAPAMWSAIGLIVSAVVLVIGFVYLWFCYFPGGYKKSEVMDIGEYAMFVAQVKHEERKKKLEKTEEEEYVNQYDELYYEMTPRTDNDDDDDMSKGKRDGSDWQSVGTSEQQDIEGGEYYDGTSSSSPSTQSQSQSGYTYDGRSSSLSPSSQATPSQSSQATPSQSSQATPSQRSLKPAMKSGRDDRSESTYTSGSGYYQ